MTITLGQAIAIFVVSGAVLAAIALMAIRSTRTIHPVYCVHCWAYREEKTIISYSEEEHRWGICHGCVGSYWRFEDEISEKEFS